MEIEIARSVNSQLYKLRFHIYQMEDNIGHSMTREVNDLCLGPGLADSVLMEVTPDDGTGNFTYTDEGTIFELCPAGAFQLFVPWHRYNYDDQEYEYAGTFRRYFFINGDDEEATSIEQVKFITALYPDTPVSHDEVQIQGTKQSKILNRELTTFSLTIDGLVPDSDTETTDYAVRVRIIGGDRPGETVPWCNVGNVGYSYLLKTVPEDGQWAMEAHVLGNCLQHSWPDTLQVELFDGSDLTNYSEPLLIDGYHSYSYMGELQYPEYGTHEFIAGKDIALGALPNRPATGGPTISGTAQIGETLTVDTSGIADADGLDNADFTHRWLADDTAIQGTTGSTYTLVEADEGKTIKVRVTFTDDAGNEETLTSVATETVAGERSVRTDRPRGLAAVAQDEAIVLTWEEPDITREGLLDYHILRHRPELGEAGPLVYVDFTYTSDTTFTDTDVEPGVLYVYQVKAVMNFFGDRGEASDPIEIRMPGSQTSQTTEEATPNRPATGAPLITGTAQVGEMLTADTSGIEDADGLDNATFSYQWLADDAHISGATDASYTLVDTDVGKTIKVEVTFTDDGGNQETLTSAGTEEVAARPNRIATGQPTISGIAQVGERLTADTSGIADEDELVNATFSYQWIANDGGTDTDIADATGSSYTLVSEDEGKRVKVRVFFTDDPGNEESLTSLATAGVASRPNSPANGAPTISGTVQLGETLTASTSGIADEDGLTNVSYLYQWVRNDGSADSDIAGATASTYELNAADEGKTIKVRVSFTDDAGNDETLTSQPTATVVPRPSLTAQFQATPASHDGQAAFTLELRFSEEFDLSYKTLRDHAFTVTGGAVTKSRRLDKSSNTGWEIHVRPDGNGSVTVLLPVTTDCESEGAICTWDGRKLSNRNDLTVGGPS